MKHYSAKTRTLSLLLALLLTAPILASCSESAVNTETEKPSESSADPAAVAESVETVPEETELQPNLPDITFDDQTFTILTSGVNDTNGQDWQTYDIWVESMNGEVINDTVFERNLYLEDTYKVKIAEYKTEGTTFDEIKKEVTADSGAFNAAMTHIENSATLAQGGFLHNLYTAVNIDTSMPWWDQRAVNDLEILGKLYFATGDITVIDNDATWVLMFSKQMHQNYQLDNLYDLVRENKWNYDVMLDMITATASDLNGDGALTWQDDQFGFITSGDSGFGLMYASGEKLATTDENKQIVALKDAERLSGVVDKASLLMANKDLTFQTGYESTTPDDIRTMFEEGRGLFYGEVMQCIIRMRASETDFGLIPWPKYDEIQTEYYNWIHTTAGRGVVIPSSQDDLEIAGVVLEAMAAKSMYTVTPAYYEVSMTYKYMRDTESAEMLDIILQSRIYDLAKIYNLGGVVGNIATIINQGTGKFASTWKSTQKIFAKTLEKVLRNFEDLES